MIGALGLIVAGILIFLRKELLVEWDWIIGLALCSYGLMHLEGIRRFKKSKKGMLVDF